MTTMEVPQSFGYEQTLMYGRYSRNLAEEAKLELEKLKKERAKGKQQYDDVAALKSEIPEKSDDLRTPTHLAKLWEKVKPWLLTTRDFLFTRVISEDWFFLALLGLIMALLAYGIDYAIIMCAYAHQWLYDELSFNAMLQFTAWVLFTVVFILFSTGFVHIVSPNAIGSGIPEMKTILRGVILKEYLSFRTGVSKVIGLIAALGSGLPFGREGPFVHLSSIIATLLGRLSLSKGIYENESRQSEMLAAACAVGVACTFSAPIGGVLFSIEVTATLFAVSNYWRGFFAAVWSALMFRLLKFADKKSENITALFQTNFVPDYAWHTSEIIAYVFLGVICGLGGALFVNCHRRFVLFIRGQRQLNKFLQRNRFIYPFLVALLVSSLSCPLTLGQYMAGRMPQKQAIAQLFSNFTWTGPNKDPNVLEQAILENWEKDGQPVFVTLVVFFIMNFWMSVISITLPVPAGSFIPVFVLGAALGRICGEAMASIFPSLAQGHTIIPGGYAVVGAAAFSGAATHTISTTVIVCELTGQIKHILPLTCAVLIANFVAKKIDTNIFDSIIKIKKLPYLPHITNANSSSFNIFVDDFMIKDIFYVTYTSSTYKEIQTLLNTTKLRAYPLVDSHQHMILLGSVQRAELQLLLDEQIGSERRLRPPDEGSERNSIAASPAVMRRNRSSNNVLDSIPNFGGLEQVKEQLRRLGHLPHLTAPTSNSFSVPLSAPATVRGLPKFDAKPGKSILKRNPSIDDQNELDLDSSTPASPKFFIGDAGPSSSAAAGGGGGNMLATPARPRKSALKKYNPYHTFSGIPTGVAASLTPDGSNASSNSASNTTIGGTTKETSKKNPLSSLFQPLDSSPKTGGIRTSVSSLFKSFGNRGGSNSQLGGSTLPPPPPPPQPRRKAVCELSEAEQKIWEERQLEKTIEYHGCVIDPAPFQLVAHTSLHKVHSLFSLLALKQAYVTNIGRLVGVVSLVELRKCIEGTISGKVVPKPIVPPAGSEGDEEYDDDDDDDEAVTEVDEESEGSSDDGGASDQDGLPMGPTKFSYGYDRVSDSDQLRKIRPNVGGGGVGATSAAAAKVEASSAFLPGPKSGPKKAPVLEPIKMPTKKDSSTIEKAKEAEDKLSSIFEKPALPNIGASSILPQAGVPAPAEEAPSKKESLTSPISVMVTPVTPPAAAIVDDPLKPTHSPTRVQGSRFRRFVVDESKLDSKPDEQAAAAAAALTTTTASSAVVAERPSTAAEEGAGDRTTASTAGAVKPPSPTKFNVTPATPSRFNVTPATSSSSPSKPEVSQTASPSSRFRVGPAPPPPPASASRFSVRSVSPSGTVQVRSGSPSTVIQLDADEETDKNENQSIV